MQLRGDDAVRVEAARQMLDGFDPETKYSISLIKIYEVLIGTGRIVGNDFTILQVLLPAVLTAAVAILSSHIAFVRGQWASLLATQASIFSLTSVYTISPNSDLFSAALIVIGLTITTSRRFVGLTWSTVAIAAMTLGAWNVQPHAAGLGVVGLMMLIKARRAEPLISSAAAAVLIVAEATTLRGTLTWSKYGTEFGAPNVLPWEGITGFGYPILFGVIGILFSLGRGLMFFIPTLWFSTESLRSDEPHPIGWLLLHTLVLVPIYGSWWAWYGGVGFGPRFFVIGAFAGAGAIAFALSSADQASVKRTMIGVLSLLVSGYCAVLGMFIGVTNNSFNMCVLRENFRFEPLCWYSAEYSPLLAPFWDDFNPLGLRPMLYIFWTCMTTLLVSALAIQRCRMNPN